MRPHEEQLAGMIASTTGHIAAPAERSVAFDVAYALARRITESRDGNPLRRRFLDETMVSASRVAIAARLGR